MRFYPSVGQVSHAPHLLWPDRHPDISVGGIKKSCSQPREPTAGGTHDNLKKTLITIGSIAAVLLVGIVLFTISIKSMHRDAAKASAEKQAEAEQQRKVDAVAKRIVEAQAKRDASPITEATNKLLIDEINSPSERFEMPPTNLLRMHYVGSRLGFTLRDYGQFLANLEENANAATGGERQRNLSKLPKKVYPKLAIDAQLPEQDCFE